MSIGNLALAYFAGFDFLYYLDYFLVAASAFIVEIFYATFEHYLEKIPVNRTFGHKIVVFSVLSVILAEVLYWVLAFRSITQALYVGSTTRIAIIGIPELIIASYKAKTAMSKNKDDIKRRIRSLDQIIQDFQDTLNSPDTDLDKKTVEEIKKDYEIRKNELKRLLKSSSTSHD